MSWVAADVELPVLYAAGCHMGHMASDCTLKHIKVTPVLCFAVSASGKS